MWLFLVFVGVLVIVGAGTSIYLAVMLSELQDELRAVLEGRNKWREMAARNFRLFCEASVEKQRLTLERNMWKNKFNSLRDSETK